MPFLAFRASRAGLFCDPEAASHSRKGIITRSPYLRRHFKRLKCYLISNIERIFALSSATDMLKIV